MVEIDLTCNFKGCENTYGVTPEQLKQCISGLISLTECDMVEMVPDYVLCETKKSRLLLIFDGSNGRAILSSTKSIQGGVDYCFDVFVEVYKLFVNRLYAFADDPEYNGICSMFVKKVPYGVDTSAEDFDGDSYISYEECGVFETEVPNDVEFCKMYASVEEPLFKKQGYEFGELGTVERKMMLRLGINNVVQYTLHTEINFMATSIDAAHMDKYADIFKNMCVAK